MDSRPHDASTSLTRAPLVDNTFSIVTLHLYLDDNPIVWQARAEGWNLPGTVPEAVRSLRCRGSLEKDQHRVHGDWQ
jgi:hypothetical protein